MSQSTILDQFSRPFTFPRQPAFARGASGNNNDRPTLNFMLGDVQKLIPTNDRRTLISISRHMIENWGPMKAVARQIPMYAVGASYNPTMNTTDSESKDEAERVIRENFWPIGDIRGGGRDMTTLFYHAVHCLIRDGEFFILLTEYSTGFPAVQLVPCHKIGSGNAYSGYSYGNALTIEDGKFKGSSIEDGIIFDKRGTVIGYRFLEDDGLNYTDIDARSMIHCFDSDYPEARRGYPAMAHGLNDARDSMQSHEWERINMLWRSSILAIENNESGIASEHPAEHFGDERPARDEKRTAMNVIDGPARMLTYQAGSGSKVELLKHDNPGEIYESFNDRMIKTICAGVPWPYSFVWSASGQGTAERREIEQARRTIKDIQATIDPIVKRITGYAFKKFVKLGILQDSPDWWRWTFSHPPVLSIDPGRDTKATLDMHARGLISDNEMLANLGWEGSAEEYWESKFKAAAVKELAFQEVQFEYGVKLDPRIKGMFTPNDMAPATSAPTTVPQPAPEPQTIEK